MKKVIAFSVVALIIIGGGVGYFLSQKKEPQTAISTEQIEQAGQETQTTPTPSAPVTPPQNEKPVNELAPAPQAQIQDSVKAFVSYAVVYTDTGFLPPSLEIKRGDTVTFENRSTKGMWPASAMHPTHKEYPTTGGCIGSTFDACKSVLPKEEWSFTFDKVGTWRYHNHVNSSHYGSIIVK